MDKYTEFLVIAELQEKYKLTVARTNIGQLHIYYEDPSQSKDIYSELSRIKRDHKIPLMWSLHPEAQCISVGLENG